MLFRRNCSPPLCRFIKEENMSKKVVLWVSVLAVLTGLLSSCQEKFPENPELPGVVTTRVTTSMWVEGTFETAYADEVGEDVQESPVTESADAERSDSSVPVVTPADRVYDVYPMKIIYPAEATTSATVTVEAVQEDVYTPDGKYAAVFTAEYPVISGITDGAAEKINREIKAFIDRTLTEFREYTKNTEEVAFEPAHKWEINMDGVDFAGDGYDINGNIFSVYFADYAYGAPAAHGSEAPTPMIFDLRTGDKIKFSDLIEDSEGFADVMRSWFGDYLFNYGGTHYGMIDAEQYVDILRHGNDLGNDFGGDERMTVYDGCVGFYLSAYQYGSFADGVRRVDIPVNEVFPYLNEKGRSLFEGYVSAESVPANVIEYKGKKYFDTTLWVPDIMDESNPTDGDIEFVSLFENAWRNYHKLYGDG